MLLKLFSVVRGKLAPHVAINQLALDGKKGFKKHIIGKKLLFDLSLFLLGNFSEKVSDGQLIVVRISFHDLFAHCNGVEA